MAQRIQDQPPEALQSDRTVGILGVGYGMLHPRVGGDDEVARHPRPDEHRDSREPVCDPAYPLFAVKKQAEEGGLKEECEGAFHGECLADHSAGIAREE
jgi:hypothetical protein